MRGGDAKPRRAARKTTIANPQRARRPCRRASRAKRRNPLRAKAQLSPGSVLFGVDREFVRSDLFEELLELRDLRLDLFFGHLFALELDAGLLDHVVGRGDR